MAQQSPAPAPTTPLETKAASPGAQPASSQPPTQTPVAAPVGPTLEDGTTVALRATGASWRAISREMGVGLATLYRQAGA